MLVGRTPAQSYGNEMTRCTECGFNYKLADAKDFARLAAPFVDSYAVLLRTTDLERLQLRPAPYVWSPLEFMVLLDAVQAFMPAGFDVDFFKANGAEGVWMLRRK